jgi:short-chain 2-methylacyl-CoA dehydrogenase
MHKYTFSGIRRLISRNGTDIPVRSNQFIRSYYRYTNNKRYECEPYKQPIQFHNKKRQKCLMSTTGTTGSSNSITDESLSLLRISPITVFTEDETIIRDTVKEWGRTKLLPLVRSMDNEGSISPTVLQDLFDQGYMSIEIPTQYTNGSGLNFTSAILVIEEIARIDPSIAILVDIHNTLTINAIRLWGTAQQQQEWLPKLATNTVSSFCLSEANSGSDAFALQTTATISPDQSYYTLDGIKSWISNAQQATMFLMFANVDVSMGYKGITAFLIDTTTTEGITICPPENKLGLRASSTCQIIFDNVKIDACNVLGEVGMGYKYCIQILNEGRIGIAAQQLGIAKACLYDIALPYMMERKQFNQPIGTFQGMQHQYALAATEIHATETMIYNACRMKEMNMNFVKEASMCKYYAANVAERTASKTIEWLGGIGYTKDMLAEKFYRDCKVGSIYEGTSNIQLQTIAKILMTEYK